MSENTSSLTFIDLVSIPTKQQKDCLFSYNGFGGTSEKIKKMIRAVLNQKQSEVSEERIKNIVSSLMMVLSGKERYEFKKIIIDCIKFDFSYEDKLNKELLKQSDEFSKKIIANKIKMMKENIDTLSIPSATTQNIELKKFFPRLLPDGSFVVPLKSRVVVFVEHIVLTKQFEGGEYGGIFSGIDEQKKRVKETL